MINCVRITRSIAFARLHTSHRSTAITSLTKLLDSWPHANPEKILSFIFPAGLDVAKKLLICAFHVQSHRYMCDGIVRLKVLSKLSMMRQIHKRYFNGL
ncbi:hypothetical protein PUN28_000773 [Cardiocondyla obscurior]|uniref:Uncharacterized protein n=1 Tax=Cardiocondyla obscurior TaxID=286306 RepID=A0AAW2H1K0_9HYME